MILYAAELEVTEAKVKNNSKEEFNGTIELDEENERLKLTFEKSLEVNSFFFK